MEKMYYPTTPEGKKQMEEDGEKMMDDEQRELSKNRAKEEIKKEEIKKIEDFFSPRKKGAKNWSHLGEDSIKSFLAEQNLPKEEFDLVKKKILDDHLDYQYYRIKDLKEIFGVSDEDFEEMAKSKFKNNVKFNYTYAADMKSNLPDVLGEITNELEVQEEINKKLNTSPGLVVYGDDYNDVERSLNSLKILETIKYFKPSDEFIMQFNRFLIDYLKSEWRNAPSFFALFSHAHELKKELNLPDNIYKNDDTKSKIKGILLEQFTKHEYAGQNDKGENEYEENLHFNKETFFEELNDLFAILIDDFGFIESELTDVKNQWLEKLREHGEYKIAEELGS